MADPVSATAAGAALPPLPHMPAAQDPQRAAQFAQHMSGDAAGGTRQSLAALEQATTKLFSPAEHGTSGLLAGLENSLLTTVTPQDFLRATIAASNVSIHVSMSMMKFHLSSSLGSAVTSLFGTLLKNRD